jgi:quinoprotein glucose dehydrogenase
MFRAWDKTTGRVLWQTELPAGTSGAPMTYMHEGRQYIATAIGGAGFAGELIAYRLPE